MCAHVTLTFIKVTFCDIVEPEEENGMSEIIMDFGSEPQEPQASIFHLHY